MEPTPMNGSKMWVSLGWKGSTLSMIKGLEKEWLYVGGLSNTTKMPGYSYGIPAAACKTGGKLRQVKGSICSKCYAHKGFYVMTNVKTAYARRLEAIAKPKWVECMVKLLSSPEASKVPFFRWHDSGDVQNEKHLEKIFGVCRQTPHMRHWMPTKEAWVLQHKAPENLVVRYSLPMIDQPPAKVPFKTAASYSKGAERPGFPCPSKEQGNACLDCRVCWGPEPHVSHEVH